MNRAAVAKAFLRSAGDHFRFLDSAGFLGPEQSEDSLTYHSPGLSVEVAWDQREGSVATIIRAAGEPHDLIAGLPCLYVAAGLGPAQHVPHTATSAHSLEKVLAAQAEALAEVLPRVHPSSNPEARALIERCHRR